MVTILAILLYLNVIGPGTYTPDQINQLMLNNQQQFLQVQQNQDLLNQVDHDFDQKAQTVVIIDYEEEN